MMSNRYYLAGPMTGIPQFNFPAFHAAAASLRAKGYEIVSPAEMDSPAVQTAAVASTDGKLDTQGKIAGETWGEILARDVQVIADTVNGIVFLPGWTNSRGARLEATVGLLQKGFLFYTWSQDDQNICPFPREAVAEALYRKFQAEAA